ncbi:MAG: hypothetical protein ACOYVJ_12385 [Nitrospirota bacterium]
MSDLPVMDFTIVNAIKRLMENIKNDRNAGNSMDDIADMVYDHKLYKKKSYKPLLQSICDLLREKGYPATSDLFLKIWHLRPEDKNEPKHA